MLKPDNPKWAEIFQTSIDGLTEQVLKEAKRFSTYGEATNYVHQLSAQAFGQSSNATELAAMELVQIICKVAMSRLHEEERSLPIQGDENNDK